MPTVRGWAAAGAAVALALLWIGFGERLLLAVATFLALALLFGIAFVRTSRPRVGVSRRISPIQVHEGDRALVEIRLSSPRGLRHVAVTDDVVGLGTAHFLAEEIDADEPLVARYEVLCRPRGVYAVGPASVTVQDPLALVDQGGPVGSTDRLVVYPTVESLEGLPVVRGQDPSVQATRANFSHSGGDDFFTLREYQQGDDLRRVHWPSSAKHDELMIRQLEMPWQSRALVLLDQRASGYPDPADFEQAVRGAASVVHHLYRNGFSPGLWAGSGNAAVRNADAYNLAMEALALVRTEATVDLQSQVARLRRGGVSGGALIMVTGAPDEADLAAFRLLSRDFLRTVVMAVTQIHDEAILQFKRAGAVTVVTSRDTRWAPVWREAMEQTWSTATAG